MAFRGDPPETLEAHVGATVATAIRERHGWEVEISHPQADGTAIAEALGTIAQEVSERGGGLLRWRVTEPDDLEVAAATEAGWVGDRVLWQMRRPLPAPAPKPPLQTRAFVPGPDNREWLRVNNAAFAWHPEQGGWTEHQLAARLAEPWFDPQGFLLHPAGDPGDPIDGFCWTKIDRVADPTVGEIFVIAVDPARSGTGLGRRLVLAGLDHLYRDGASTGMLYTEADNEPARRLYEDLEFKIHLRVRVFHREVPG